MHVVVVHHHLEKGGVTSVVRGHLAALEQIVEPGQNVTVTLLHGGRTSEWPDPLDGDLREVAASRDDSAVRLTIQSVTVAALDYDGLPDTPRPAQPSDQVEDLTVAIRSALEQIDASPDDTVLHIHNPTLGKVAALPGVVVRLADDGWPIVLQIHDFAEDGRPENYDHLRHFVAKFEGQEPSAHQIGRYLYPIAPRVVYAVLTQRDEATLASAGLPGSIVRRLPNPVRRRPSTRSREDARAKVGDALQLPPDARYVVYPVRGIRRKNLGEMLLLATHPLARGDAILHDSGDDQIVFAVTQPPINPRERPAYDRWQDLAERLSLPCRFSVGRLDGLPFEDHIAAADAILTTSVAEGFGLVYLEASLAGRLLIGRDLPDVTRDFREAGVAYPYLYDSIDVPVAWLGEDRLVANLSGTSATQDEAYGLDLSRGDREERWRQILSDGWIDFARLTSGDQTTVIERVAALPDEWKTLDLRARERAEQTRQAIPRSALAAVLNGAHRPEGNGARIEAAFGLNAIGQQLMTLYRDVLSLVPADNMGGLPNAEQALDGDDPPRLRAASEPEAILHRFSSLEQFRPVRIED